jgi:hypothetical protein
MRTRVARPFFLLLLLLPCLAPHALHAAPPDKKATAKVAPDLLVFTNGDQLTGKLMHSTGKTVAFHSDMAGDVTVDWSKVKELRSARQFVVLSKGKHWNWHSIDGVPVGSITVQSEKIEVKGPKEVQVIPIDKTADVVDLQTYQQEAVHEGGFFRRWAGTVNLGTTLVEATQNTYSFNGGASVVRLVPALDYLPPRNRTTADFSGSYGRITQPQAAGAPQQPDLKTAIYHADAERDRYLSTRFYLLAQTAFDHNFSQGLDLQQIYGAGVGWTVLKQSSQTLDLKATLQYEKQEFLATTTQENTNLFGSTLSISYMRKLPYKAVFQQQAQYLPAYNHPYAYSASESNSLTLALHKRLSFVIGTQDSYINNPPPEIYPSPAPRPNSFQLTTGVSYSLK